MFVPIVSLTGVRGSSSPNRNDYMWVYFPSLLSDVIN